MNAEPTDLYGLIAENRGVIAAFGDTSSIGNLARRTAAALESTAAELARARECIAKVRNEAREWADAPEGEFAPCNGVGPVFLNILATYDQGAHHDQS